MSEVKAKKASLLTIEKELLSSYIEAITDMKRVRDLLIEHMYNNLEDDQCLKNLETADNIVDKHVNKLKSSGIWE